MTRQDTGLRQDMGAVETVKERDLRKLERDGYAVMSGVLAFGAASKTGRLARAVHAAKLVVIAFTFITPVYLFWATVF